MNDLAIVIFSCDNNEELWPIWYHCINKYWKDHPNIYLLTETKSSDLFKTISCPYSLDKWTVRIRESLNIMKEQKIIFICDDCFIKENVNIDKLNKCIEILDKEKDLASINFELSFDQNDKDTKYDGFKEKTKESLFILSLLCGIWKKKALIDILSIKDTNPWILEDEQNTLDYKYYQLDKEKVISWFRDGPYEFAALYRGKWSKDIIDFLKKENLEIDLNKKGFY